MRLEERGTACALERMMPGEQLIRDDTPGVEIDAMIDRWIGGELLGRHVRRSADGDPGAGAKSAGVSLGGCG
jgi:hypothetical protein